ncbi:MAG: AAA family ATPase [Thermoguttaceae bacterium]|nr:AAA family ATPase [Thermoguttaceae bacterium]MDW8038388.1 AAA family ATPase [Thermoguttaceae bacterium]
MNQLSSPSWLAELHSQLARGRQVILWGNVADRFLNGENYQSLPEILENYFIGEGYQIVLHYDRADGVRFAKPEMATAFEELVSRVQPEVPQNQFVSLGPGRAGRNWAQGPSMGSPAGGGFGGQFRRPEDLLRLLRQALQQNRVSVAGILHFADKLFCHPEQQSEEECDILIILKKAFRDAAFLTTGPLEGRRNVLLLVAENIQSVPGWLYSSDPFISVLNLPRPKRSERDHFISRFFRNFYQDGSVSETDRPRIREKLVDLTDGFTSWDLEMLRRTSIVERIPIQEPQKLVDFFKFGKTEDPWRELSGEKLREALPRLEQRVLGQRPAVRAVVDMLARARGGISMSPSSGMAGRPKGVLFFCGPTGVGKTELARALTELIFSDERAFVRFDMSEFKESHTVERLIGAPPSYVGYQEGGQLTGPCLQRPFSLFLFDEIDKAHHAIWDIFLQILEDGRLTDSRGQTAYFSKACLVFTSNLGGATWTISDTENLPSYEEVYSHYRQAVEEHFKYQIGRPELLNRLGENIVVFDILRPEFFPGICQLLLDNLARSAQELYEVQVQFDPSVCQMICQLMRRPENFMLGGRRIRALLQTYVETALNKVVPFVEPGSRLTVSASNSEIFINGKPCREGFGL